MTIAPFRRQPAPARCRRPEAAHARPDLPALAAATLGATWLGHATVLVRMNGRWLLTDPALESRIGIRLGPATVGPKRLTRPALTARELPPLDLLLISHAHMDHLDLGTLRQLPRETPVVAHRGLRDLLGRFHNVVELEWGQRTEVGGLAVEAIPARHWGARLITDRHRGYGGFLVEGEAGRVVYTGDTAYHERYRELADRGHVDLAILPIGAYDPWIDNHASPEEAWAMGRHMRAHHVLPVHHATFRLSREPMDEPLARFLAAAGRERWRVAATALGEMWRSEE